MRFHRVLLLLTRLEWIVLLLAAPVLLFPERFPTIVVCLAMVILVLQWSIRYLTTGHFFPSTPLNIPILCLLLTVPLSLYASANFATSLPKLTGLLFGLAIFFMCARTSASAGSLPYVMVAWLLSALSIAVLGLVGTDWTGKSELLNQLTSRLPHLIAGLTRSAEGGLNPNEVGGLLALFVPLTVSAALANKPLRTLDGANLSRHRRFPCLVRVFYPERRAGRLVWLLATLLLSSVLILTESRSALFGVTLAVAVIFAVRNPHLRRLLLIGVVIGAIAVFAIGPLKLLGSLFDGAATASPAVGAFDLAGRGEIWSRALYAIQDFPFTGVGLNQFPAVVNLLYPLFLVGPEAQIAHAHNLYLQAAVDFGLGGLVSYIAILCCAGVAAMRAYRALPTYLERALVLGLGAGLLAHQLYGLSDAITLGAKPSFEWWLFLAVIMGLYARSPAQPRIKSALLRFSHLDAFLLWPLTTLIAIACVGENALLGVGLAVLGGCALGCAAILAHARSKERETP